MKTIMSFIVLNEKKMLCTENEAKTINNDHINLQILKNCYHYCFSILIFRFSFILMHQAPLLHNKHKICQITHVFKIPFTNKLFSQKNSCDIVKHI